MRLFQVSVALLLTLGGVGAASDPSSDSQLEAEADLQLRIRKLLSRAKQHLEKYQGFLPFGGALSLDGEFHLFIGPKPKQARDLDKVALRVASGLKQLARLGETRSICMAVLVRTTRPGQTEKSEAVWLRVEHFSGLSKSIFYPYVVGGEGDVELGDPFTVSEAPDFFISE
jgi:hypothetical protein